MGKKTGSKKRISQKILALSLAVVMGASILPVSILAQAPSSEELMTQQETTEATTDSSVQPESQLEDATTEAQEPASQEPQEDSTPAAESTVETETEEAAVPFSEEVVGNGIEDLWVQDPVTVKTQTPLSVNQLQDGWLYLKAGVGNGNTPTGVATGANPAVFVNNTMTMPSKGFYEMTFKPELVPANTRAGVYLNYQSPGDNFFVGYDSGGWFWEKYVGNASVGWFGGGRVAAPAKDEEVTLHIEWDGKLLTAASVTRADGTKSDLFGGSAVDFSQVTSTADKIAIKVAGWNPHYSGLLIKEIHYTGQKTTTAYEISGRVVDEKNAPLAKVAVSAGNKVATTATDGTFTLKGFVDGVQTLKINKDRYQEKEVNITVAAADQTIGDVAMELESWALIAKDGALETWKIDPTTAKGGEVNEIVEDKLHLASGMSNANDPSATDNPAVFVNQESNLPAKGTLDFDITANKANNKAGVYLFYTSPGDALYVGFDEAGWFYQVYANNTGAAYGGQRVAAPANGKIQQIHLEWDSNKLVVATVDGKNMFASGLPLDFSAKGGAGTSLAVRAGTASGEITDISLQDIFYTGQKLTEPAYRATGIVVDEEGERIENVLVSLGKKETKTDANGEYELLGLGAGEYSAMFAKQDYETAKRTVKIVEESVTVPTVTLAEEQNNYEKISSAAMEVSVDPKFPRVARYTLADGTIMYGQTQELDSILINGKSIVLSNVSSIVEADKISYTFDVQSLPQNIDATIDAFIKVEDNTLAFEITKVTNKLNGTDYPVQTIEIPNHSLVSVRTTETGANVAGAVISTVTTVSGDTYETLDKLSNGNKRYMYAFVSNDATSAGLWSNSEYGTAGGGRDNNRVTSTVATLPSGEKTLGLSSSAWTYERKITTKGQSFVIKATDMPKTKVAIAQDLNNDAIIDWQDGAIAFRDIMNNPVGSEEVPELVGYRVAMNFGGQAQNPFSTTLDNVKRVYNSTDGLGQSVLLKGYGSEGHDSGHPDYADIGQRIGGVDDMNSLMISAKNYGARMGIHINAGEMYAEAKAYTNDSILYRSDGSLRYGWNWLDQGIGIDGLYDLATGNRKSRLQELYDEVGNNLDFVYLDIWGNNTSSDSEDAWQSRKVAQDITSFGWRFGNEWTFAHEYDTTFQHWATDLAYGGATSKGQNSLIMRFIRNHQRDTWVAEYSSYGGAAVAPLLGGYSMYDFEGWQGRNNYATYIDNLYLHDLSTKFLQHYTVSKLEMGELTTVSGVSWIPEVKVVLTNEAGDVVEVTRGSGNYAADPVAYRSRTITLNGKVVLQGEMARGEISNTNKGSESYLIPWNWDVNTGEAVASGAEKLYHWNTKGGTTTWELPDGWASASSVKVYRLTDTGRTDEQTISVSGGKVTLTAQASTAYVLYKGAQKNTPMVWGENTLISDGGFNSGNLNNWTQSGSGTAEVFQYTAGNPLLKMAGEKEISQKVSGLVSGKTYAVYVGVDNRSDAKAWMQIKDGANVLAENYSERSIAQNYIQAYAHNRYTATAADASGSYFQNMYVFFKAPASGEVSLVLKTETGAKAYYDDIRLVKTKANNAVKTNSKGQVTEFKQDFENNAQGLYPFVIGNAENVTDNRTHLSQKNGAYTQAGWKNANDEKDAKYINDVLGGEWSIKTNGISGKNNLVYQTIPQNFRFEPGVSYKVTFNYEMGNPNTYKLVVGDGEFDSTKVQFYDLESALEINGNTVKHTGTKTATINVTGSASGKTWIGIYSADTATIFPDHLSVGTTAYEKERNENRKKLGGYNDFILDDLHIVASNIDKATLVKLVADTQGKVAEDYDSVAWPAYETALKSAKDVLADFDATQKQVDDATAALQEAVEALIKLEITLSGIVKNKDGNPIPNALVFLKYAGMEGQTQRTDANGKYTFSEILMRDYTAKIFADGYEGKYNETVDLAISRTPATEATQDFELKTKDAPDYSNRFDAGDVSMMQTLQNSQTVGASATTIYGSDALKIEFSPSTARVALTDLNTPKFRNGIFEATVTPQQTGVRFGLVVRGIDNDKLLFAASEANKGQYFWEYFGGGADGTHTTYGNSTNAVWPVGNEPFQLKIKIEDKVLSYWVDDTLIFEKTFTGSQIPPDLAGAIGFYSISKANSSFVVDNIEVTSLDPAPVGTYNVEGVVTSKSTPVHNATIKLLDNADNQLQIVSSDLQGKYTLKNLVNGTYKVVISKLGHKDISQVLTVAGAEITGFDIVLTYVKTLEDVVAEANALNESDYQSGWSDFAQKLQAAKDILAATQPSQADVDTAMTALQLAMSNLDVKVVANKVQLSSLITQVQKLEKSKYAQSSWANLESKLAAALAMKETTNATQAQVDQAAAALQAAVDALVKNPTGGTTSSGTNGSAGGGTAANNSSSKAAGKTGAVRTGDTTNLPLLIGIIVVAGIALVAVVVVVYKKRKKNDNSKSE